MTCRRAPYRPCSPPSAAWTSYSYGCSAPTFARAAGSTRAMDGGMPSRLASRVADVRKFAALTVVQQPKNG